MLLKPRIMPKMRDPGRPLQHRHHRFSDGRCANVMVYKRKFERFTLHFVGLFDDNRAVHEERPGRWNTGRSYY